MRWASGCSRQIPNAEPVLDLSFDGIEWAQVNRAYLSKYFPPGTPLIPEFKPSLFFRTKPSGLFRVVCLGGSSMFGTPYIMSGTIPAIVRKQLRHLMPDRDVEVVNWSATAINSNVVRDLSEELIRFEPDLVLVYMGHNEFYGPDGIGANALERWMPFLTRLKYDLREFRLMQVLQGLFAGDSPKGGEINLMRQVSGATLVPLDSDESRRIFARFEANLIAIIQNIPLPLDPRHSERRFVQSPVPAIRERQHQLMLPPCKRSPVRNTWWRRTPPGRPWQPWHQFDHATRWRRRCSTGREEGSLPLAGRTRHGRP